MFERFCRWICTFALCSLMINVGGPSEVQAAGIFFSGNGVVSGGRAGATVATGDSADSYIHNPANLSKLKGFGLRFDNIFSFQKVLFTRAPEGKTVYDQISKKDAPAYIPALSFWYGMPNIGPGTLTFTLFAHAPHARSGYHYPEKDGECKPAAKGDANVCKVMPESGPNRLALIKTASITLYFGLAAAYEWRLKSDVKLRFGGTFRAQYIDAFQRMSTVAASTRLLYNPSSKKVNTGEVLLDISAQGVGFTGDLGFSLDLPLGFSIGTSVLFPVTAKLSGVLNVQLKETLEKLGGVEVQGKGLEIETSFPMIFRSGVGWRGHGLVVEATFVAEFWSEASTQKFKPKNITFIANKKPTLIPDLKIEQYFRDSYSIRIGAEYNIKNWVWVRAGWWYETGSLEEKYLSVSSIDYPNRMALTGGVSVKVPGGMMLSVSVMHILGREVTITNSPLRPIDLSPEGDLKSKKEIPSTSNGTYQFGNTTLFLGFRGNWGPGSGTRTSLAEAE